MTRNYELVYYVAQNVGIIGILAYPKSKMIENFYFLRRFFSLRSEMSNIVTNSKHLYQF